MICFYFRCFCYCGSGFLHFAFPIITIVARTRAIIKVKLINMAFLYFYKYMRYIFSRNTYMIESFFRYILEFVILWQISYTKNICHFTLLHHHRYFANQSIRTSRFLVNRVVFAWLDNQPSKIQPSKHKLTFQFDDFFHQIQMSVKISLMM